MIELIAAVLLVLLVVFMIVVIAGLVLRRRRSQPAQEGDWHGRALDACAAADALRGRIEMRLTSARSDGEDESTLADRWSDTERSVEDLKVKLHVLRFEAPDYTTHQAMEQLIMALAALRSALPVENGAQATWTALPREPVSTAPARLMEVDAAVRALRAAI